MQKQTFLYEWTKNVFVIFILANIISQILYLEAKSCEHHSDWIQSKLFRGCATDVVSARGDCGLTLRSIIVSTASWHTPAVACGATHSPHRPTALFTPWARHTKHHIHRQFGSLWCDKVINTKTVPMANVWGSVSYSRWELKTRLHHQVTTSQWLYSTCGTRRCLGTVSIIHILLLINYSILVNCKISESHTVSLCVYLIKDGLSPQLVGAQLSFCSCLYSNDASGLSLARNNALISLCFFIDLCL